MPVFIYKLKCIRLIMHLSFRCICVNLPRHFYHCRSFIPRSENHLCVVCILRWRTICHYNSTFISVTLFITTSLQFGQLHRERKPHKYLIVFVLILIFIYRGYLYKVHIMLLSYFRILLANDSMQDWWNNIAACK